MRVRVLAVLMIGLIAGCGGTSEGTQAIAVATEFEAEWARDAVEFRERKGDRIAYICPADGQTRQVWGVGPYTDDSSVCSAGVHAGVITVAEGGRVVIEITDGEVSYDGSEANGVTTAEWAAWPGSFDIVRR